MRYRPLVLLILVGCDSVDGYECFCRAITNYDVLPNAQTPDGISFDSSGMEIDLNFIDSETGKMESCLKMSINRDGFNVKVAPDWYVPTDDMSVQIFPCDLPPSYCGNQPTCACYGAVQPPRTIVVTPNLAAYRHELIHLVTDAHLHNDPVFALCDHSS